MWYDPHTHQVIEEAGAKDLRPTRYSALQGEAGTAGSGAAAPLGTSSDYCAPQTLDTLNVSRRWGCRLQYPLRDRQLTRLFQGA